MDATRADPPRRAAATPRAPPGPGKGGCEACEAGPPTARWYLGFDCATKTFAFSLSRVDFAAFRAGKAAIARRARAAREVLRRAEACAQAAREALAPGGAGAAAAQAALAEAAQMADALAP